MSTITDKLIRLAGYKEDIKQTITDKTDTDAGDNMSTYAEQIESISGGEGLIYNGMALNVMMYNDYPIPEHNIQTNNNEVYFIYDNRDRQAWFIMRFFTSSGTIRIAKGHIGDDGNYVEDALIRSASATNVDTYGNFDLDYDYTVIKATGNITYWRLSNTTMAFRYSVNGINQPNIEILADLPTFLGSNITGSISGYNFNSAYLKKFTLKNATPRYFGRWFYLCRNLEEYNFVNCDMSQVTILYNMFAGCRSIKHIDFNGWNAKITVINGLCNENISLDDADLTGLNINDINIFDSLFSTCYSLKSVKLPDTVLTKDVSLSSMFSACRCLKEIDLTNITFNKVTSVANLVSGCNSLKTLKLPTMDLSDCISVHYCFQNCNSLVFDDDLINNIESWNINKLSSANSTSVFEACYNLKKLDISKWDLSGITGATSTAGMHNWFNNCYALEDVKLPTCNINGQIYNFFMNCRSIRHIDMSGFNITQTTPMSFASMFNGCYNVESIKLPKGIKTKSCSNMFKDCTSLKTIEGLDTIDTTACTTFESMFASCRSLEHVDLSAITIGSDCTTLASMFADCFSLNEAVFNKNLNHNTTALTLVTTMFNNNYTIKRIECEIPCPNITRANFIANAMKLKYINTLWGLDKVTSSGYILTLTDFTNLEWINFTTYHKINFRIDTAINLSKECILDIFNKLDTVSAKTITLGTLKNKLTTDEIKIATDKGWTVA